MLPKTTTKTKTGNPTSVAGAGAVPQPGDDNTLASLVPPTLAAPTPSIPLPKKGNSTRAASAVDEASLASPVEKSNLPSKMARRGEELLVQDVVPGWRANMDDPRQRGEVQYKQSSEISKLVEKGAEEVPIGKDDRTQYLWAVKTRRP